MTRFLIGLSLLFTLGGLTAAQVAPASAYVDSSPLGARIVLDGVLTEQRTPALLRGLTAGRHTVSLWKEGFVQVTQTFAVSESKIAQVKANLPPTSVVLSFPGNDQVSSTQGPLETSGRQFRYPGGMYFLSAFDETARMTPIFPDTGLLDSAGWSLALTGGSAAAMAALDWQKSGSELRMSKLTIALGTAALADLAWYIGLQTRKARYYAETAPVISPEPQRLDRAPALFNQGEEALQSGDLAAAEAAFIHVVRDQPDSRWVPGAWFRLAKIHLVTGRGNLAMGEYLLVAQTFPQAAYHDKARKALADLYEAAGERDLALDSLNAMTLADDFFDPEAIAQQRTRLEASPEGGAVSAESGSTPRQGYERSLRLFAVGHPFTAEEITRFEDLKARLSEVGDDDLAADLDLVRAAVSAGASAAESKDGSEWEKVSAAVQTRVAWQSIRDAGLVALGVSTTASLLAAAVYDREPNEAALWTMGSSMSVMGLSLFPLLWAEPRQ